MGGGGGGKYVLLLCDVIRGLYSNSARTRTNEIASFTWIGDGY